MPTHASLGEHAPRPPGEGPRAVGVDEARAPRGEARRGSAPETRAGSSAVGVQVLWPPATVSSVLHAFVAVAAIRLKRCGPQNCCGAQKQQKVELRAKHF